MVEAGAQLGAYRLIRRIGSGGMAEVFLAQKLGEEGFARTVAIKTILAHGAEEEAVRLFLDEARVAAALEHAAIIQTFDLGYENETLFIVMEYVSGPTLSKIVRELKKKHDRLLPAAAVAHIGARVAAALDYAHRRATSPDGTALHLVHRDISPQNILLTRSGLIKLSDFGVARASIQTHKTKTGQVRGKAAYMAPEQVRAKALDGRTDIFALGLVLFEALTARRAFHRKGDIQSMRAVLTDPVPPVRSLNPDCPPQLEAAVMRCVEKDPAKRFQNAAELEQALSAVTQSVGSSHIENQISEVIDELFGQADMYTSSDEGPAVEAWQPTIAAQAQGVRPMRIGGRLDPEVARMLETPPSSADSPAEASSDSNQHLVSPVLDSNPSLPTGPTLTPDTATYGGVDSHPFVEPPDTASGYSGLTNTQPQTTNVFPRKRLMRFGLPLLAALLGMVGMLAWRMVATPAAAPVADVAPPPVPPATTASPAVIARPDTAPKPAPRRAAPKPHPAKKVSPRPAPKKAVSAPPPPPPPRKKTVRRKKTASNKKSIEKRLMSAASAHESRGDKKTASQLKRILLNVMAGQTPSAADRALLESAEAALR